MLREAEAHSPKNVADDLGLWDWVFRFGLLLSGGKNATRGGRLGVRGLCVGIVSVAHKSYMKRTTIIVEEQHI